MKLRMQLKIGYGLRCEILGKYKLLVYKEKFMQLSLLLNIKHWIIVC